MQPRSCYAICAGYEIHYMDWQPAGEPLATVIAWHGLARTGRDMDALAQFLAGQGYRVICPDTLGRGLSQWSRAPSEEYSLRFMRGWRASSWMGWRWSACTGWAPPWAGP